MQKETTQNIIIKTEASDNRGENKLAFSQNSKGVYNLMEYSFYYKNDARAVERANKMLSAIDEILTRLNGNHEAGEKESAPLQSPRKQKD